jgi:hypothetical protein
VRYGLLDLTQTYAAALWWCLAGQRLDIHGHTIDLLYGTLLIFFLLLFHYTLDYSQLPSADGIVNLRTVNENL